MLDCFAWKDGAGPHEYQLDILRRIQEHRRVSFRGPHGLGKTATAAWTIWWFALTRDAAGLDWKAPSTAGVRRQLEELLWPEIRFWLEGNEYADGIRWDLVGREPVQYGRELLDLRLKLDHGRAFGATSSRKENLEGVHATQVLYWFDESKAIADDVFDAAEGALVGSSHPRAAAFAIASSTPGEPSGRFYDIHSRKPGLQDWNVRHVTIEDLVAAGRVQPDWVENRRLQWGEQSQMFQNRALGNFYSGAENSVVPLAWIELANERWHEWVAAGRPGELYAVGLDIADKGKDKNALAPRYRCDMGIVIDTVQSWHGDQMGTVGRVCQFVGDTGVPIIADASPVGAGVVARLRELRRHGELESPVVPFLAQDASTRRDRTGEIGLHRRRDEAYWAVREMLDPEQGSWVAIAPDDELTADFTTPTFGQTSSGEIKVESKKDFKKRLKRSPDKGDATMQVLWYRPTLKAIATAGKRRHTRTTGRMRGW